MSVPRRYCYEFLPDILIIFDSSIFSCNYLRFSFFRLSETETETESDADEEQNILEEKPEPGHEPEPEPEK